MITRIVKVTAAQMKSLENGESIAGHTYDPTHCLYLVDDPAKGNIIDVDWNDITEDVYQAVSEHPGALLYDVTDDFVWIPNYDISTGLPYCYYYFEADSKVVLFKYIDWENLTVEVAANYQVATMSDLTNMVTATATLTTNQIILGDNNKKVKPSGVTIATTVSNDHNSVPTGKAVMDTVATSVVKYNDLLMPLNPFGGSKVYIDTLDNALVAADKRYWVTATKHKKVVNNVSYPYKDTSKAVTDDNYFVDSPVLGTYSDAQVAQIFNGSYENGISCASDEYIKIRIMFGSNTSPSQSIDYFGGYPYGRYLLSYYYSNTPTTHSRCHIYNKYEGHGLGWSDWEFGDLRRDANNINVIESVYDYKDLHRSCVEFIIFGGPQSTTTLTQIDWVLDRPDVLQDASVVTRFGMQRLYDKIEWYYNHALAAQIYPNGDAYFHIITEDGTSLVNKYESLAYRVTSISSSVNHRQYPSAKAVYEALPQVKKYI